MSKTLRVGVVLIAMALAGSLGGCGIFGGDDGGQGPGRNYIEIPQNVAPGSPVPTPGAPPPATK